jgi:predicted HNH restriction endonuclease
MPNTFIVLTDDAWIENLRTQNMNGAIFPKGGGDTTIFEVGDSLYFATSRSGRNQNKIAGRGVVTRVEYKNSKDAWDTYPTELGFKKDEFNKFLIGKKDSLKLIHLDCLQWLQLGFQFELDNDVYNSSRGKNGHLRRLTNVDDRKIIQHVKKKFLTKLQLQEVYINDQIDEELEMMPIGYQEGAKKLKIHRQFERNQTLITQVKQDQDRLPWTCDICQMRFDNRYNVDYIEAHHKIPLSQAGVRMTRKDDIALLCANCHRAVHKKMAENKDREYIAIKSEIEASIQVEFEALQAYILKKIRDKGEL